MKINNSKNSKIIYPDESYAIQGTCFEVYKNMGCGFLESVYQECLMIEFKNQNIQFLAEKELQLKYKNVNLRQKYMADFICYEKIILEIKAINNLLDQHTAQVLNYLNATGLKLGILVYFGHFPNLEYKRIVL